MTQSARPAPQRSHARSNRARILEAARRELSAQPDVSLDEIARAAGVVRRTLYGHFPGRTALLEALGDEASEALSRAIEAARNPADGPEEALARFQLEIWRVGDRYRMLLTLARRDLGDERLDRLMLPATRYATGLLERGQRAGVFHDRLPAPVLASAQAALCLSLMESINAGQWDDDGGEAAVAALIAAGVPPERAAGTVRTVRGTTSGPDSGPGPGSGSGSGSGETETGPAGR
ncbi:TetR/AcrR family transcriptional regulator [Streptomyces cacaoi]|uniref:TetR family transcriptional regulator n=1 Tax=Streptomyces cacaoi TaxID=1898 RepID=A0A4Y3R7L8_STRCI|nr:TetR/AcrR family transcriptional regulator [Streptomyces cacaoi]NNG84916.1 TetR/AcrR family transcriptional regulator [Streptomyces cacaoi]GEB52737.1 TetR family transcriptional regulator [Streptomyces cacaoi]